MSPLTAACTRISELQADDRQRKLLRSACDCAQLLLQHGVRPASDAELHHLVSLVLLVRLAILHGMTDRNACLTWCVVAGQKRVLRSILPRDDAAALIFAASEASYFVRAFRDSSVLLASFTSRGVCMRFQTQADKQQALQVQQLNFDLRALKCAVAEAKDWKEPIGEFLPTCAV